MILPLALGALIVTATHAYTLPDVLLVRSAPRAKAAVVTRLPMGTVVELEEGKISPEGYVAVRVRNDDALTEQSTMGFAKKDMLGNRPADDVVKLNDEKLNKGAPVVIGVCFQNRVALLAELEGQKLRSLVETGEESTKDSPRVKAAIARLRARALQLTTIRFSRFGNGLYDSGYLVQPDVVTNVDVLDTVRSYIDMGPCPRVHGEVSGSNGVVFVSAPLLHIKEDAALPADELAGMVRALTSPVHGLRVFQPAGDVVEVQASGAAHLFRRGTTTPWRTIGAPHQPVWLTLASGAQLRVGSSTEDVSDIGWGNPGSESLWKSPAFIINVIPTSAGEGVVEGSFVLHQYGC